MAADRAPAGSAAPPDTVAITGMACETALGSDVEQVWRLLLRGADGFRELPATGRVRNLLAAGLPGGPVGPGSDGEAADDLHERYVAVAAATAARALADAGVDKARTAAVRLVLGTSLGPHADSVRGGSLYAWARDAGRRLGVVPPPVALSTACSAGSDAVSTAGVLIRAGVAERCVAGGVDLLSPAKRLGHSEMGVMSPTRLRPFDAGRDGTLPGEGAAFVVLERLDAARERGAAVHGVLAGWGASNAAASLHGPDESGATGAAAVAHSLAMGGREPHDVAIVSMHGTGTVSNDAAEAALLRRLFGSRHDGSRAPVVIATKGALGHTLGASGAIDTVLALLALRDRTAPPVAGLRRPMDDFPLPLPVGAPLDVSGDYALNVTLGVGGFNTSLLLGRGDGARP